MNQGNDPAPDVIGYEIWHQPRPRVDPVRYEETIRSLHVRVAQEAARLTTETAKAEADRLEKDIQRLESSLVEFLQTPLKSDRMEIHRALGEAMRSYAGLPKKPLVLGSREFRVHIEKGSETKGGNFMLQGGLSPENGCPTYHSVFQVRGGEGLDFLESIVRDQMGITQAPHGDHVLQAGAFVFGGRNLLFAAGEQWKEGVSVFFEKRPGERYEALRAVLTTACRGILQDLPGTEVSFWQRKLGFGRMGEFLLDLGFASPEVAGGIVAGLQEALAGVTENRVMFRRERIA